MEKMRNNECDIYSMEINNAMLNNEFIPYFQPIIDSKSMKITCSESLIRWRKGDRIVPPLEFLPIIKKLGNMVMIDNWMLEAACMYCNKWHHMGWEHFCISVNTSHKQICQQGFPELVKKLLNTYALEPKYLSLEINEDEKIEDIELYIDVLSQLKDIGVTISLDDFGSGYSSFYYVSKLPIDILKIDKSLIAIIEESYKNRQIIKSIISMAHSFDIKVVAEGVETWEQFIILSEVGCDLIQGYLIGKPMNSMDFERRFIHKAHI